MNLGRVIYLHGFASGPGSQKAQFFRRKFAECGVAMEIPDLAAGDFENLTISGQLQVVEHAAGGQAVTLLGSSMGGYLAALYAARHTEVERVILMAPAFGFAKRWTKTLAAEELAKWRTSGWLDLYHYGEKRPARVGYRLIEDGSLYEDEPDVTQPALIFHGSHDDVVPAGYSREVAHTRPNVRLEVLDSDHELLDQLDRMWLGTREFCTIVLSGAP
jgi:pimeloyl-ACP methyl ester carboxylesterase